MPRGKPLRILCICLTLVLISCSGDGQVFPNDNSDSGAPIPLGDVDPGPDPEDDAEFDPFAFGINYEFAAEPQQLTSNLGGSDAATAAALQEALESGGVDLTGMEVWVFDVIGSDDRLLVIDVNRGAEQVPEESDSADLLEVLTGSPVYEQSGITRIVINFFGTDTEGAFILTTTMDIDALLAASSSDEELDETALGELAQIEIFRVATPPTATDTTGSTTTTQAPATTGSATILVDTFDGATTLSPLFPPGVMSTTVTSDGTLNMSVLTTGVIPALYPDPVPDDITVTFDFTPMPNGSTASFGAVVLAEDPSDGALDHYVAVWANPSDGMLTIIPFDQSSGGWGAPTAVAIPAAAGFAAGSQQRMELRLIGGTVEVALNSVNVTVWSGATPVTTGHWGPVIIAAASGDAMVIDNVLVRSNE